MIWLLLVTYVCFVIAFAYLFVTNVLPFLRKHLEKTSKTTLQYPQWVYVDLNATSDQRRKTRLAQEVATYATGRYDSTCTSQNLWHVFLHSGAGRPVGVRYDRNTFVVNKTEYLDPTAVRNATLRARARCVDNAFDSQFASTAEKTTAAVALSNVVGDRLAGLARRFSYKTVWRTAGDVASPYLVIVFFDEIANKQTEFEFRDLWATAGLAGDLKARDNSLPPVWTMMRSANSVTQYDINANPGRDAPLDDTLAGSGLKTESPCYDSATGRVRPGLFAVANVKQLERLYLRGVGSYDATTVAGKIGRCYYECRYDVNVDDTVAEETTRDLPIRLYLRVCPSDKPVFDPNLRVCRKKT